MNNSILLEKATSNLLILKIKTTSFKKKIKKIIKIIFNNNSKKQKVSILEFLLLNHPVIAIRDFYKV